MFASTFFGMFPKATGAVVGFRLLFWITICQIIMISHLWQLSQQEQESRLSMLYLSCHFQGLAAV